MPQILRKAQFQGSQDISKPECQAICYEFLCCPGGLDDEALAATNRSPHFLGTNSLLSCRPLS